MILKCSTLFVFYFEVILTASSFTGSLNRFHRPEFNLSKQE